MFHSNHCTASIWDIVSSFRPTGMLNSAAAEVGITLLRDMFKESNKLVLPYFITVSFKCSHHCFFLLLFCSMQVLTSFVFFRQTKIFAGKIDQTVRRWFIRNPIERLDGYDYVSHSIS